jgi:hypothetical protein
MTPNQIQSVVKSLRLINEQPEVMEKNVYFIVSRSEFDITVVPAGGSVDGVAKA